MLLLPAFYQCPSGLNKTVCRFCHSAPHLIQNLLTCAWFNLCDASKASIADTLLAKEDKSSTSLVIFVLQMYSDAIMPRSAPCLSRPPHISHPLLREHHVGISLLKSKFIITHSVLTCFIPPCIFYFLCSPKLICLSSHTAKNAFTCILGYVLYMCFKMCKNGRKCVCVCVCVPFIQTMLKDNRRYDFVDPCGEFK